MELFDDLLIEERARKHSHQQNHVRPSDDNNITNTITTSILRIVSENQNIEGDLIKESKKNLNDESNQPCTLRVALTSDETICKWLVGILHLPISRARIGVRRLLSVPSLMANAFPADYEEYFSTDNIISHAGWLTDYRSIYFTRVVRGWCQIVQDSIASGLFTACPLPDGIASNLSMCYVEMLKHAVSGLQDDLTILVRLSSSSSSSSSCYPTKCTMLIADICRLLTMERTSLSNRWLSSLLNESQSAAEDIARVVCWLSAIAADPQAEDKFEMCEDIAALLFSSIFQMVLGGSWKKACLFIRSVLHASSEVASDAREMILHSLQNGIVSPVVTLWATEDVVFRSDADEGVTSVLLFLMTTLPSAKEDVILSPSANETCVRFSSSAAEMVETPVCCVRISLSKLFDGVNSHFSATDDNSRRRGATVAVAYTRIMAYLHPKMREEGGSSPHESLGALSFDAYPKCLEHWLKSNVQKGEIVEPFLENVSSEKNGDENISQQTVCRLGSTAILHMLPFPLNASLRVKMKGHITVRNNSPLSVSEQVMPSFGKTRFSEEPKTEGGTDGGRIPIRSAVEGIHFLCGIGGKPNESEKDRAMYTEASLRALPSLLREMLLNNIAHRGHSPSEALIHQRIGAVSSVETNSIVNFFPQDRDAAAISARQSDPFASMENALGPMASNVIMALVCCDIAFPNTMQREMDLLRSEVLSLFIACAPLASLHQIAGMLFHTNYSISQRVMLYHALQSAIRLWATSPERIGKKGDTSKTPELSPYKRVYPPIDFDDAHTTAMSTAREVIAARVEEKTRRWGSSVKGRGVKPLCQDTASCQNRVPRYAESIITALLEFYDHRDRQDSTRRSVHGFSFLGEADMLYCPAELLRTLYVLYEHFSSPAGSIIMLSTRLFPFLCEAVKHPHAIVRAQSWMTIAIVLNRFAEAAAIVQEPSANSVLTSTLERLTPMAATALNGNRHAEREASSLCRSAIAEYMNMAMRILNVG